MPGVLESEFSYEEGSGVVTYDPESTDPDVFLAELAGKTGFQGRVVVPNSASDGDEDHEAHGERNDAPEPTDHEPTDSDNR